MVQDKSIIFYIASAQSLNAALTRELQCGSEMSTTENVGLFFSKQAELFIDEMRSETMQETK